MRVRFIAQFGHETHRPLVVSVVLMWHVMETSLADPVSGGFFCGNKCIIGL